MDPRRTTAKALLALIVLSVGAAAAAAR
jgi:hypothetical protein